MALMIDVEVHFSGGTVDALVHPSRGEDGAPPAEWKHPNGDDWDVYLHDAGSDAPGVWHYLFDRTEARI